MIRILLAEDQSMVLGAMAALLDLEDDFQVIGRAKDGQEALDLISQDPPDVLVSDIEMPKLTGLDLAAAVRERNIPVSIIIVTTFARPGYLRRAMDNGVKGYLLKDAPSETLARAIRRVHAGGKVLDPELAVDAWSSASPLSERESETLRHAESGASNKEIADLMNLSPGTVRNYLSEAIGKLNVSNRIEAARKARENGWL